MSRINSGPGFCLVQEIRKQNRQKRAQMALRIDLKVVRVDFIDLSLALTEYDANIVDTQ